VPPRTPIRGPGADPKGLRLWPLVPGSSLRSVRGGIFWEFEIDAAIFRQGAGDPKTLSRGPFDKLKAGP